MNKSLICLPFFCFTQVTSNSGIESLHLSFMDYGVCRQCIFFRVEKYLFVVRSDNVLSLIL